MHFNPRSREGSDTCDGRMRASLIISIHAPVKGATTAAAKGRKGAPDFNPRSREGSDRPGTVGAEKPRNFNPRSREGSDR